MCLRAQIYHVNVGPQSHVVSEIPAHVVRIVIDDDIVAVPEPPVAVGHVIRCDAEKEAAEPEPVRTSADQAPYVVRAERSGKAAVFPRAVEVVMGIVPGPVPNPAIIGRVNVRGFRMVRFVVELRMVVRRNVRHVWRRMGCRRRTPRGNVSPADLGVPRTGMELPAAMGLPAVSTMTRSTPPSISAAACSS